MLPIAPHDEHSAFFSRLGSPWKPAYAYPPAENGPPPLMREFWDRVDRLDPRARGRAQTAGVTAAPLIDALLLALPGDIIARIARAGDAETTRNLLSTVIASKLIAKKSVFTRIARITRLDARKTAPAARLFRALRPRSYCAIAGARDFDHERARQNLEYSATPARHRHIALIDDRAYCELDDDDFLGRQPHAQAALADLLPHAHAAGVAALRRAPEFAASGTPAATFFPALTARLIRAQLRRGSTYAHILLETLSGRDSAGDAKCVRFIRSLDRQEYLGTGGKIENAEAELLWDKCVQSLAAPCSADTQAQADHVNAVAKAAFTVAQHLKLTSRFEKLEELLQRLLPQTAANALNAPTLRYLFGLAERFNTDYYRYDFDPGKPDVLVRVTDALLKFREALYHAGGDQCIDQAVFEASHEARSRYFMQTLKSELCWNEHDNRAGVQRASAGAIQVARFILGRDGDITPCAMFAAARALLRSSFTTLMSPAPETDLNERLLFMSSALEHASPSPETPVLGRSPMLTMHAEPLVHNLRTLLDDANGGIDGRISAAVRKLAQCSLANYAKSSSSSSSPGERSKLSQA